jgi:AraC family transcriptional regulator of arabinose operon
MPLDWERLQVRIAWGERVRCELWWRLGRRGPDSPEIIRKFTIWHVWAGRGTVEFADHSTAPLHAGICLWMRPGNTYLIEQDRRDRLGVSAVHFDLLTHDGTPQTDPPNLPPEMLDLAESTSIDAMLRRVVELVGGWLENDEEVLTPERRTATMLLTGVLMDLDLRAEQAGYSIGDLAKRRRVQQMLQLASQIRESSGNIPPVRELAERAGYSADHFARLFESVVGLSPQAFAVHVRVDRARQLLVGTDMSMKEIADALGYQDVFFFSRQFKQKTGMPPSEYRRQALLRERTALDGERAS